MKQLRDFGSAMAQSDLKNERIALSNLKSREKEAIEKAKEIYEKKAEPICRPPSLSIINYVFDYIKCRNIWLTDISLRNGGYWLGN